MESQREPSVDAPHALLIAPYFLPRNYGGGVQLYDGLLRHLRTVNATVLAERQGAPVEAMEQFDCHAAATRGYEIQRIERLCFHYRYGSPLLNVADGVWFFARAWWEFRRCLANVRPDVVICGGTYAAGWLLNQVPPRIARINYVHGEEITQEITGGPVSRLLRREQVRALRRADVNIVVSGFTARAVTELAGVTPDRILVQPNCIDTDRFHLPVDREALRRKWGWPDRIVLLTVARLVPRKGVDRVLRALALLPSQGGLGNDWLYAIAGRGPEEEDLQALCSDLGLSGHVRFLGFVPDEELPGLYGSADVFILANREVRGDTEGFGLVFLEANACGLPAIAGVAGGTADAVEDGVTGLRVDGEDIGALAHAIALLMTDPGRRERMRAAGVERVSRRFNLAVGAAAFEAFLLAQLDRKREAGRLPGIRRP